MLNDTPRRTAIEPDLGRRRLLRSWVALLAAGAVTPSSSTAWAASADDPPAEPAVMPGSIFNPSVPLLQPATGRVSIGTPTADLPEWVKSREAWGALGPVQPYVPHTPVGVSLHHTGAPWHGHPGTEQYLRNVQAFHIGPQREWEDIAYHYLVDLEGGIWAGRPPTVRGNPSIYYDSTGVVLISFLGDYGTQDPSEAQVAAAARTAAWLVRRFELDPGRLTGHRDHAPTSCPGDKLYGLLRDGSFAGRVRAFLA